MDEIFIILIYVWHIEINYRFFFLFVEFIFETCFNIKLMIFDIFLVANKSINKIPAHVILTIILAAKTYRRKMKNPTNYKINQKIFIFI